MPPATRSRTKAMGLTLRKPLEHRRPKQCRVCLQPCLTAVRCVADSPCKNVVCSTCWERWDTLSRKRLPCCGQQISADTTPTFLWSHAKCPACQITVSGVTTDPLPPWVPPVCISTAATAVPGVGDDVAPAPGEDDHSSAAPLKLPTVLHLLEPGSCGGKQALPAVCLACRTIFCAFCGHDDAHMSGTTGCFGYWVCKALWIATQPHQATRNYSPNIDYANWGAAAEHLLMPSEIPIWLMAQASVASDDSFYRASLFLRAGIDTTLVRSVERWVDLMVANRLLVEPHARLVKIWVSRIGNEADFSAVEAMDRIRQASDQRRRKLLQP
jgi:hypothetical protein